MPPEGLLFNGRLGDQPPKSFDCPIATLFFGTPDGRHMSSPMDMVIWVFDEAYVAGIEFIYSDASQNRRLGCVGPFGEDYSTARDSDDSQDHCITMSIDGAKGEELESIEVQENRGIAGLRCTKIPDMLVIAKSAFQLRTNFGREMTTPPHPFSMREKWTTIRPTGSKVVGPFRTHVSIPL